MSEKKKESGLSQDAKSMMQFEAGKKSVGIAYLLWFFLGGFGLHRFYLGQTGSAVALLIITLVSIVTSVIGIGLFGFIVVGIWLLVDLFLIPGIAQRENEALMAKLS